MENESGLLDMEVIEETAEFGIEDLRDLIEVYIAQAKDIMGKTQTMLEVGDLKEASLLAHRLAGSSAACGAVAAMNTLHSLELSARDGHSKDCAALFDRAIAEIEASEALLAEYLGQKGCPFQKSFAPPERRPH